MNNNNNNNNIIIGLDLGTDNCCITYQDKIGRPFIIMNNDHYLISSIIAILNDGILVGNTITKDNIYDIPIITNLKRLIGHKANDEEIKIIAKYYNWNFKDSNNDLIIIINNNEFSLNQLMCLLLTKIKEIIIMTIGEKFETIITIPANFNEGQKNLLLNYCKIVNIKCKRLIYEPCSAALTYINYFYSLGLSNNQINEEILTRIMVFDFGAGTLDLSIVTCSNIIDNNNIEWLTKIETNIGDNNLGGIDINILLKNYIIKKYPSIENLLLSNNKSEFDFFIEKLKLKFSDIYINKINDSLKFNNNDLSDKSDLAFTIVENYYNNIICIDIVEYFNILNINFKNKIINLLDKLHIGVIKQIDIDTILLIGGSSYNPWIKELLETYYNKKINDYKLKIFTHDKDLNLDIKKIGVSLGATCIEKKINKNGNLLILTESLPLSIGIEINNNIMCKILKKNSIIPCSGKKYFTTSEDNQKFIDINIFQGERDDTRENYYLGKFRIDNLEPEIQGKIIFIISIALTTDGIITIESKVKNTNKYDKKYIINRYNININEEFINNNIKNYELNDNRFNIIMQKYYHLITMLNKLKYNLIDNIIEINNKDVMKNIILIFWDDLIIIFKLLFNFDKFKNNINQLNILINIFANIIDINPDTIYLIDNTISSNYETIAFKLDNINKLIEIKLSNLVSTYQIKTNFQINDKYSIIDDNEK